MLMQGELNLSSSQCHVGSFAEMLRHTMINQEFTFRKQLLELHRLYKTQQRLMQDLCWSESGNFSSRKASGETALGNHPKLPKLAVLNEETFSATLGVNLNEPRGQPMEEFCRNHHPRPPYFQKASVWQFNHHSNDLKEKHRPRNGCKVIDLNADSFDDEIADPEKFKLSLGSGVCSKDVGSGMDWLYSRNDSCSNFTIDLESSTKTNKDAGAALFLSRSIISGNANSTPPHGIKKCTRSNFLRNRQSEFNLSIEGCAKSEVVNCVSAEHPKVPLSEHCLLDLNEVHLDDLSCDDDNIVADDFTLNSSLSGDLTVENSEARSFNVIKSRKADGSTESVPMLPKGNANTSVPNCIKRNDSMEICAKSAEVNVRSMGKLKVVQLETFSEPLPSHSEFPISSFKTREKDVRMTSDSSDGSVQEHLSKVTTTKESDPKSSRDDKSMISEDQDVLQDGKGNLQSDGNSIKIKTLQSGIAVSDSDLLVSDENSRATLGSQVASFSPGRQGQVSNFERENDLCKDNDFVGIDVVQIAAESLIQLSFESPLCYKGSCRPSGSNGIENKSFSQALSSSDSFELNVLNLEECNVDDDSVSSKAFEVVDPSKQDFSCKLRRGRRLKDFQKDILPGLASLSRHEILEDINILEQVLRSREYRKLRAGMADGDRRCTSVRSRQSRASNIRRRRLR